MSEPVPFNIKADAKQMMLVASGLVNKHGKIESNLELTGPNGIRLSLPTALFPFLKPEVALVTLSIVQITVDPQPESVIERPGLIIPGRN